MCISGGKLAQHISMFVLDFSITKISGLILLNFYVLFLNPKSSKLYCPNVRLDCDILECISCIKYISFTFNMNIQNNNDILRQMSTFYIRSNNLLRTFHYCTIDVKLELFRSFCMPFYCCYLWTAYKKSTFDKLRVAFNNAYRRVLNLP